MEKHLIAEFNQFFNKCESKTYDFSKTLNKILKTQVPTFPIDGELLKEKGMKEGQSLGNVLKN